MISCAQVGSVNMELNLRMFELNWFNAAKAFLKCTAKVWLIELFYDMMKLFQTPVGTLDRLRLTSLL